MTKLDKEFFLNLQPKRTLIEARQEITQLQKKDKETADRVRATYSINDEGQCIIKEVEQPNSIAPQYFRRVWKYSNSADLEWYYKVYENDGNLYCDRLSIEGEKVNYIQSVPKLAFEKENQEVTEADWKWAVNVLIQKIGNQKEDKKWDWKAQYFYTDNGNVGRLTKEMILDFLNGSEMEWDLEHHSDRFDDQCCMFVVLRNDSFSDFELRLDTDYFEKEIYDNKSNNPVEVYSKGICNIETTDNHKDEWSLEDILDIFYNNIEEIELEQL